MAKSKKVEREMLREVSYIEPASINQRDGHKIQVMNLRVGDSIVTKWGTTGNILKSMKVEKIDECASKRRTHCHINRRDCYDVRSNVWVK